MASTCLPSVYINYLCCLFTEEGGKVTFEPYTPADLHEYSSSYILSLCFQLEVFQKKEFSGKILFLQKTLNHHTKTIW